MILKCPKCGNDYSDCGCGSVKSPEKTSAAIKRKNERKAWLETIPIATRCGSCTVDYRRVTVFRIEEHTKPYASTDWSECVDQDSTKVIADEVFAKVKSGTCYLVRRFVPVRLHDEQMKKFGFGKQGVDTRDAFRPSSPLFGAMVGPVAERRET